MRKKHCNKQSGNLAGSFWAGKGLDCHCLLENFVQKSIFNRINDQFTAEIFQVIEFYFFLI